MRTIIGEVHDMDCNSGDGSLGLYFITYTGQDTMMRVCCSEGNFTDGAGRSQYRVGIQYCYRNPFVWFLQ